MNNIRLTFLVIFLFYLPVSADFSYIGVGAGPQGMANAYTCMSDSVYGLYYNPGGLAFIRSSELTIDYARLYYGLKDNSTLFNGFAGYAAPLQNNFVFGAGWQNFSLLEYYTENSMYLSLSKQIATGFGFGINVKFLSETYSLDAYAMNDPVFGNGAKNSVNAVTIDQGILWNFYPDMFIGFSIINLTQPNVGLSEQDSLPIILNLGIALRKDYSYENLSNYCIDITYSDNDYRIKPGLEVWTYKKRFAFRTGFEISATKQYSGASLGTSINFVYGQLDYSFSLPLTGIKETQGTHKISILYRFVSSNRQELRQLGATSASNFNILEQKDLENKVKELQQKLKEAEQLSTLESSSRIKETESLIKRIRELEVNIAPDASATNIVDTLVNRIRELERKVLDLTPEGVTPGITIREKPVQKEKRIIEQPADIAEENKEPMPVIKPKPAVRPSVRTYTVQPGDTLADIAQKFSVNVKDIYETNKNKVNIRGGLTPGLVLIIP